MRRRLALAFLAASALPLSACAYRTRACCEPLAVAAVAPTPDPAATEAKARIDRARRLMDEARARTPYLPMKPEAEARAAMPSMKDYPAVPNLIRIAAAMPKTMDAEMKAWRALQREGTIDRRLMNEVFYVVSSGNECGH